MVVTFSLPFPPPPFIKYEMAGAVWVQLYSGRSLRILPYVNEAVSSIPVPHSLPLTFATSTPNHAAGSFQQLKLHFKQNTVCVFDDSA